MKNFMGLLQPHTGMSIGISFETDDDDDMTKFVAKNDLILRLGI
jgi:hypothetical protein